MINYDLTKIRALIFDVDGVLSDSNVLLMGGQPVRTANIKDGYALQHAAKTDLKLAIITGGRNETIKERYMGLGIADIFMGVSVKIDVYRDYLIANELKPEEVLYMGDDIPDYEVMKVVPQMLCPKYAKSLAMYPMKRVGQAVFAMLLNKFCVRNTYGCTMRRLLDGKSLLR